MEFREVAVIGLGTMGAGIAEVFARAGLAVVAIEADPAALRRGMSLLEGSLGRAVSRGRLTAQEQAVIAARVRPAAGYGQAAGADLAIEAVPERPEVKRQVFAELDRACRPGAILATNTSSLSVTAIAAGTLHPGRVVGMHFFNPAPAMRLVEVVSTVLAADGVQAATAELAVRLGKTPVQVGDRAGFVANALLLPYLNHAVTLLETGFASRADIDAAATGGIGLPLGPLALLDLIGLDTSLSIMEVLRDAFGGPRYTPAPLLRRLVEAGRCGRKSGRGIYDYAPDKPGPAAAPAAVRGDGGPAPEDADGPGSLAALLLYPHLADAARMVQDGYASAADVDTAMTLGCGYPRGPLEMLDEIGAATVESALRAMQLAYGDPAFAPPPLLAEHAATGRSFRA